MIGRRRALGVVVTCVASLAAEAAVASCMPGDTVDVLWQGEWYGASVIDARQGSCFVTYHGYDRSWDEWVGPERYRYRLAPGSPVHVWWQGDWYAAQVLQTRGALTKITYTGYDRSWDEWVDNLRLRPM